MNGSSDSPAASTRLAYIPAFDGVRAISVIAVFFHHSLYGYFSRGGFIGVDIFFVLSGYLITGLLLKEFHQTGSIRFDIFYQHRACRLMPALIIAVLLAGAAWSIHTGGVRISFLASACAALFFYANYIYAVMGPLMVTWSLAVEEQFYFFWPATLFFLLRQKSPRFFVGTILFLILFCMIFRIWLDSIPVPDLPTTIHLFAFLVPRLDSFLLGALVVMIAGRKQTVAYASALSRIYIPEMLFIAFVIFCVAGNRYDELYQGGYTLLAFLAALFISCLAESRTSTPIRWLLESPPLLWIGRRSYGIYLYHLSIIILLEFLRVPHSIANFAWVTVVRIVAVLAFAGISYRFIERPILRLKWTPETAPSAS